MNSLYFMLFFRAIYLLILLRAGLTGDIAGVAMHGSVFLVTLLIPLQGKKYYPVDSYLIGMFIAFSIVAGFPALNASIENPVFGVDDIFHFLAGVGLCWLGLVWSQNTKRAIAIVLCVGILWEIFEILLIPVGVYHAGIIDTLLDIIMVLLGGLATIYLNIRTGMFD